jgi:hypothetical protein
MDLGVFADLAQAVQALDTQDFWFWTGLSAFTGAMGFWRSFRALHRARLIENTPTAKTRSAPQGYIELQGRGRIMAGEPLSAPLTGLPCTWWSYNIQEKSTYRVGKQTRTRWTTIESDISDSLFLLEDDTGQCIIDPENAEVLPNTTDSWYGNQSRPPKGGGRPSGSLGGKYRYTERRMHQGDPLLAIGFMRTHDHTAGASIEEETRALLVQWKADQTGLLRRFDKNRDGIIDMKEWDKARHEAEKDVRRERYAQPIHSGVHVLSAPPDDRPYLLAAWPQEPLVKRFRRRSMMSIATFFLGTIICTFLIAARFNLAL